MAQITVPFAPGGLRLPVLVSTTQTEMARLVATGLPIPRPFWAQAEIDTGAYPTAIALPVPTGFGLSPSGQGRNRTAAGSVPVDLYRVSLGLPPMFGLATTTVLAHDLEVSALAHPIPGTDLLIGFDLILNCRLLIDGPGRTFTLDF